MSDVLIVIIVGTVFWIVTGFAIIDIARKNFGGIEKKAMWGFIALVPFIGCIVYFVFGYKRGKKRIPITQVNDTNNQLNINKSEKNN